MERSAPRLATYATRRPSGEKATEEPRYSPSVSSPANGMEKRTGDWRPVGEGDTLSQTIAARRAAPSRTLKAASAQVRANRRGADVAGGAAASRRPYSAKAKSD